MFLFRKNIILVPSDYDGVSLKKGILSIDCFNGMSKCLLKCYNLDLTKNLVLGISVDGNLTKYDIDFSKAKSFEFVLKENIKNTSEISAVLIDIGEAEYQIVLWGSTQINLAWQNTLRQMLDDDYITKQVVNDENSVNYGNEIMSQKINESAENFDFNDNKKEVNIYQDIYNQNEANNFDNDYQHDSTEQKNLDNFIDSVIKMTEDGSVEINDSIDNKSNVQMAETNFEKVGDIEKNFVESKDIQNSQTQMRLSFFDKLSSQIEKMFKTNESFEVLNEIFPNSKFCKVNFDDGSGFYVFGVIYDDGIAKYLCYGIPAQKGDTPPKEFSELYQWLPIDTNSEDGDGFYIMYQDADTGKNVSVDII